MQDGAEKDRQVKRRRTSSPTSASSSTLHSQSPPESAEQVDSHSQTLNQAKGKSRAERLAGFDDEEELATYERVATAADQPQETQVDDEDPEDLCAICLAPIDNKVRSLRVSRAPFGSFRRYAPD